MARNNFPFWAMSLKLRAEVDALRFQFPCVHPFISRASIVDFLGAFWHLLNFAAPAVFIGLFASVMAKILWRRDLAGVSVLRLWRWSAGLACLAAIVALAVFDRDGKIVNYSAMVLASAAGLWLAGFVRRA
jgi:hypothetical protein